MPKHYLIFDTNQSREVKFQKLEITWTDDDLEGFEEIEISNQV